MCPSDTQRANSAKAEAEWSLLHLLARIREAAGDPHGKLMQDELIDHIRGLRAAAEAAPHDTGNFIECHGLDTPGRVCFYEQEFYVLSNFSAFALVWNGIRFDTSEAAYHWEKFPPEEGGIRWSIRTANSAHEAFKIAERNQHLRRHDWDDLKVSIMRDILRAKARQHEYVRRKLLETGNRELVENSWRDDFWGWGPNRAGQNMLGNLWMEIRDEIRADSHDLHDGSEQ